jgi:hypothetical protein
MMCELEVMLWVEALTIGEEEPDTHSDDDSWDTFEYKEPVRVRVGIDLDGETYHCHPDRPAFPLRYEIPVARIPPKAPATATLEAKIAIRVALSSGLYQKQRYIMIPGKKPASARPKKILTINNPA